MILAIDVGNSNIVLVALTMKKSISPCGFPPTALSRTMNMRF